MQVRLEPITRSTVRAVCSLAVRPDQAPLVAPNAVSLAEALFAPAAWYRAVVAEGEITGFLMLYDPTLPGVTERDPDLPPEAILLWRLMIDARHQGTGIGGAAVALAAERARRQGAQRLMVTYVPGADGPQGFYRSLGFHPTGRDFDGESEAALVLTGTA